MTAADLAAQTGALDPLTSSYAGEVFKALRALPEGPLRRKLTENLQGWPSLGIDERKARHLRAMAILGDALRGDLPVSDNDPQAEPTRHAEGLPTVALAEEGAQSDDRSPERHGLDRFPVDDSPIDPDLWLRGDAALSSPLTSLKGVGQKRADTLASKGLATFADLLTYLPHRYDLRTERTTLRGVAPGTGALVSGTVLARGPIRMRRFPQAYKMEIGLDGNERISAVWFRVSRPQQEFFSRQFPNGSRLEAAGQLEYFDGRPSFIHPELGKPGALERGLLPVYSETEGITSKSLRQWLQQALDMLAGKMPEHLPRAIRKSAALMSRELALRELHQPSDHTVDPTQPAYPPRRRLVFDEFFLMSMGLLIRRRGAHRQNGVLLKSMSEVEPEISAGLPFELTAAQKRVVREIAADFESGHPMHRIVQGDVGSGKTLVALIAAAATLRAGYQAAFMAPTELLAEQHFRNAETFLAPFGLQLALLTGSTSAKVRRELVSRLMAGTPTLVIGTHALLEEDAAFSRLALAIVDEQHRFGVKQRAKLAAKGFNGLPPHFLVMSATPIPRSLAMTLYGDLDVSVIDELPPGRTPVKTKLVMAEADRKHLMAHIKDQLTAGRQVYWVFPLVEESDKVDLKDATKAAELLQKALPDTRVELLHGRMHSTEKDETMGRFTRGESGVLVATTVIEVGVDVPNASIMVIEHAERFGLSQLHQLRGRVGRGAAESHCYLRIDHAPQGDVAHRLDVMTQTNDGFRIAEADLEIRGSGDLLGTKQSGLPSLQLANPVRDAKTLAEARRAAETLLEKDPALDLAEHRPLRAMLERAWEGRLQFTTAG